MRKNLGWVVVVLAVATASLAPARSEAQEQSAATGFLLQGALAATTPMVSYSATSFMLYGLGLGGSLRLGGMFDFAALALDVNYASLSDDSSYSGQVKLGPLAEIFLWRSGDGAARLYGLVGVTFGAHMTREDPPAPGLPGIEDDTFVAGLKLGAGGMYFLHPSFPIGVELGVDTAFVGADNTGIVCSFFAALTLGFVAGS